ncbi:AAA family ATPase (plasmid) [Streptococcus ruminicola]|uniref:AAA family ATPase n=1 Tax=Streptococcus ruminicola TaxID=2686210 RepID=A0A6G8I2T7_9STRE|nr:MULTISPECIES: ParA family protein [Streptococcus]QGX47337.1 AAA family ATPase [Streptococcus equinus]QIM47386.1 AAA family ATPase [Streptococcus ruminicola]
MKIITFNNNAGGVGKTTWTFNTAFYAAAEGKRVLVMGTDPSCNLTNRMIGYFARITNQNKEDLLQQIQFENTVEAVFKNVSFAPITITDKIDFLAETKTLYDLKHIKEASLLHWWWDNEEYLMSNYDLILIDTHNDDRVFTKAAYAVSDVVSVLVDKTDKTFDKVSDLREMLEKIKDDNRDRNGTFVTAKIVIIGNDLDNNSAGKAMKLRLEKLQRQYPEDFIGYIEHRESVVKAENAFMPLIEYKNKERLSASLERFYRETKKVIQKLIA